MVPALWVHSLDTMTGGVEMDVVLLASELQFPFFLHSGRGSTIQCVPGDIPL